MMRKLRITLRWLILFVSMPISATAHFGMVIPSTQLVDQHNKTVDLTLSFSHPFELIGMELAKPKAFFVITKGEKTDLLGDLTTVEIMGHRGWQTNYRVQRPGVYHFVMEPQPYWEDAEDLHIIHYTKTIVAAYGGEAGWDSPVGLPMEIIPRLRPFGNYAGNSFSGQVLRHGKPVPFAEVEVEFYNENKKYQAPSDYHITQSVKADDSGVFSFTCPTNGWWGFSALGEADYTLKNSQGEDKGVELGAVLWIHMDAYQEK